jgi:hypothetical protein
MDNYITWMWDGIDMMQYNPVHCPNIWERTIAKSDDSASRVYVAKMLI